MMIYFFFAVYSLAVGSLLNLVIYRLPLMLQREWQTQCYDLLHLPHVFQKPINLFFPRSFCPNCKALIKAWQNIPLFSYFLLKGRCYQCHKPISIRYPAIELLTLCLSLSASLYFGFTLKLVFVLMAIYLFIVLFFIDLDHQLLPDSLSLSLLWLGLLANTKGLFCPLSDAVFGAVIGYLTLWLLIKFYYLMTKKIGMGHGDFKLFAALGAYFGVYSLPFILLFSSLTGALFGIIYLRVSHKSLDTRIAFGPFLCLTGLITLFWNGNL